jgi:Fic family protein
MPSAPVWPTQPGSVFFADAAESSRLSRAVAAGQIRRLGRGIYSADLERGADELIARNRWRVVAHFVPDALIADRSAAIAGRLTEAVLFVVSNERSEAIELPGLIIVPRRGVGPLSDDLPWSEGLRMASLARALVDNLAISRRRGRGPARTLSRREYEDWVARLAQQHTVDQLNNIRDRAKEIAAELGHPERIEVIDNIIGAGLGTRQVRAAGRLLVARQRGTAWDPARMELFTAVARDLPQAIRTLDVLETLPAAGHELHSSLPFYEAYFSNFIEGTEFTIDEAERIVKSGVIPANRAEDAHDILGTYRLLADAVDRTYVADAPDEFLDQLRRWHAHIMQGRPAKRPGMWKETPNQTGTYTFVAPELVEGTLLEGFALLGSIDLPIARALYLMLIVSEVHPFDDGNGRLARAGMNAVLTAAGETRILVPIVWRNEYLTALRQLSRERRINLYVRTLGFAQQWTSRITWNDAAVTRAQLEVTNALLDSTEAEETGRQLILPD